MSQEAEGVNTQVLDAEEQAAFSSVFESDAAPTTTQAKEPDKAPQPASTTTEQSDGGEQPRPKPEPKPAENNFAQITIEELEGLKSAASKTAENKRQLDTLLGTIGKVQQYLKKQDEMSAAGVAIAIPDDALSDLASDYPELAAKLSAIFTRARVHGARFDEQPAAAQPTEADQRSVTALIREAMRESAKETLEDIYPDWRDLVGAVKEGETPNPEHPFRKWLAGKDEAYQHRINNTESPAVIARAIELFQKETAKPETKVNPRPAAAVVAREDRIRSAIQPKGDGGSPVTSHKSSEEDAFKEGFLSG